MSSPATLHIHKVTKLESLTPLSASNTLQSVTIPAGQGNIAVKNWGTSIVWIGGPQTDADTSKGWPLDPRDGFEIGDLREDITFYYHCASGETSTLVGLRR